MTYWSQQDLSFILTLIHTRWRNGAVAWHHTVAWCQISHRVFCYFQCCFSTQQYKHRCPGRAFHVVMGITRNSCMCCCNFIPLLSHDAMLARCILWPVSVWVSGRTEQWRYGQWRTGQWPLQVEHRWSETYSHPILITYVKAFDSNMKLAILSDTVTHMRNVSKQSPFSSANELQYRMRT